MKKSIVGADFVPALSIDEAASANGTSIQIEYKCFKTYKKTKSVVGAAFFSVLSIDEAVTASGANIQTENLKTYK